MSVLKAGGLACKQMRNAAERLGLSTALLAASQFERGKHAFNGAVLQSGGSPLHWKEMGVSP